MDRLWSSQKKWFQIMSDDAGLNNTDAEINSDTSTVMVVVTASCQETIHAVDVKSRNF